MSALQEILDRCTVISRTQVGKATNERTYPLKGYYQLDGNILTVALQDGLRTQLNVGSTKFADNLYNLNIQPELDDVRALREMAKHVVKAYREYKMPGSNYRRETIESDFVDQPITDAKGVMFDPEIHEVTKQGTPKKAYGKFFVEKKSA